jgi:hypothetical protein
MVLPELPFLIRITEGIRVGVVPTAICELDTATTMLLARWGGSPIDEEGLGEHRDRKGGSPVEIVYVGKVVSTLMP